MSKSNDFENDLMLLLFNNTGIANLGDATGVPGSTADGSLYVALHTADPGEAGNQSTNECAYTSYARAAVARTVAGWTVSGNQASNAAQVSWPACTGGSETATHFSIGLESAGATRLLYSGALSSSLAISNGITPQASIGSIVANED